MAVVDLNEKSVITPSFPSVVRIEPSGACNLSCLHCPTGTIPLARGIMTKQLFSRVERNLVPHAGEIRVAVLYHGGEPLLNREFPQMIRSIKGIGIPFVKTVSNGMLLTNDVALEIIGAGLDAIEFSLDGQSPAENNFIRRNSDYHSVVRNIKSLLDLRRKMRACRPRVYVASAQFAREVEDVTIPPVVPAHLLAEFAAYEGEVDYKCAWALEWPHMVMNRNIYNSFVVPGELNCFDDYCDHVVNTITVRWNGDVVPCCLDLSNSIVLGNIKDTDLDCIWNGVAYQRLRASILERKPMSLCSNCNVIRKPARYLSIRPEVLSALS